MKLALQIFVRITVFCAIIGVLSQLFTVNIFVSVVGLIAFLLSSASLVVWDTWVSPLGLPGYRFLKWLIGWSPSKRGTLVQTVPKYSASRVGVWIAICSIVFLVILVYSFCFRQ